MPVVRSSLSSGIKKPVKSLTTVTDGQPKDIVEEIIDAFPCDRRTFVEAKVSGIPAALKVLNQRVPVLVVADGGGFGHKQFLVVVTGAVFPGNQIVFGADDDADLWVKPTFRQPASQGDA